MLTEVSIVSSDGIVQEETEGNSEKKTKEKTTEGGMLTPGRKHETDGRDDAVTNQVD